MITDGWHKLAEEQPEEGQRVLAMSSHGRYPMRYGNASLLYLSLNSSEMPALPPDVKFKYGLYLKDFQVIYK